MSRRRAKGSVPAVPKHRRPTSEPEDVGSKTRQASTSEPDHQRQHSANAIVLQDVPLATSGESSASITTQEQTKSLSAHSLSFILHPSHEVCTPEDEATTARGERGPEEPIAISKTCYALGVGPEELQRLLGVYFQNMTSFSLFHEPTFHQKLQQIQSFTQLNALLAAMLSFATRISPVDRDSWQRGSPGRAVPLGDSYEHFAQLAVKLTDEALQECGDEIPPLCILQALIILNHQELARGVRGKAWRSLGLCIRIAYEMNLHLIDAPEACKDGSSVTWSQDEERRRAWWAIWEMDVFASTVRRSPTAINWAQNETFLPASDTAWFSDCPQAGCYLDSNISRRWKVLEANRSTSLKAWFIVVNSLMREAQTISSPKSVHHSAFIDLRLGITDGSGPNTKDARDALSTLANALRCFVLALPDEFKYRDQHLSFESRASEQNLSFRHIHAGITSIHFMIQLAWLMINHYQLFVSPGLFLQRLDGSQAHGPDRAVVDQYLGAADKILHLIQASCEEHYKYLNPFLASTVWMATAVQLVYKDIICDGSTADLQQSKYDILLMTYKQMVGLWNISSAMQQNLDLIASRLPEKSRISTPNKRHCSRKPASKGKDASGASRPASSMAAMENSAQFARGNDHYPDDSSSKPHAFPLLDNTGSAMFRHPMQAMSTDSFMSPLDNGSLGLHPSFSNALPSPNITSPTLGLSVDINGMDHMITGSGTDHLSSSMSAYSPPVPELSDNLISRYSFDAQTGGCTNDEFSSYLNILFSGSGYETFRP